MQVKAKWMSAALCLMPCLGSGAEPLTFFTISDTHFGTTGADFVANRKAMPDRLNSLSTQNFPATVGGGLVGAPKGLLMPGDLVDAPDSTLWKEFSGDYGINGEGRTKMPVYDGLGNHDGPGTNPLIVAVYQNRNRLRQTLAGARAGNMDSLNYNYSWDWGPVHFVNLNLFSGSIPRTRDQITGGHSAYRSLDFLKDDLAKHVGASGRPVFIMQHYSFDGTSLGPPDGSGKPWWLFEDGEATYQAIKDYNVIGLLHGHTHGRKIYKWHGLDVFDDGTAQNGDIFVFRIAEGRMFMANRVGDAWGSIKLEKTIGMGTVSTERGRETPMAAAGETRFTIVGMETVLRLPGAYARGLIVDARGRIVRNLDVTGPAVEWDRTDSHGLRAPRGVYFLKLTGNGISARRSLLLD